MRLKAKARVHPAENPQIDAEARRVRAGMNIGKRSAPPELRGAPKAALRPAPILRVRIEERPEHSPATLATKLA